jgi:pimeloyl-ACP methyl ester carboxylesterase
LIIHGREDTFIPYRNSEELTKEIAGSKLVILERSGHILPLNNSRKIMALIRDFVPA